VTRHIGTPGPGCPTTVQALRSDTPTGSRSAVTALRDRFGVRRFQSCSREAGGQLLQPGVLGFEFYQPFGLVGLHAAVLGDRHPLTVVRQTFHAHPH